MNKLKKLAKQLTGLLSAIVLSSCSHVPVLDKEVCADLGDAGAHCAHTYVTKRRDVEKSAWDRERIGWMCTRSDDFSDTEDSIDELCRTTNLCDFKTKEKIQTLKKNMAPVLLKARAAKNED